MKKVLLVIAAAIVSMSVSTVDVKAQEKENVVKLSLSNLIVVTPTLFYEKVLNEKSSAQLGAYFTGFSAGDTKFSGIGFMPEYRFYPGSKGAPQGFFVAPFLKYQNYSLKATENINNIEAKASITGIGGGAVIGAQFLLGNVVALDMYIGPSVSSWSANYEDNVSEDQFNTSILKTDGVGVGVRFGVSLGFGF